MNFKAKCEKEGTLDKVEFQGLTTNGKRTVTFDPPIPIKKGEDVGTVILRYFNGK